jgi:hypothetical protein
MGGQRQDTRGTQDRIGGKSTKRVVETTVIQFMSRKHTIVFRILETVAPRNYSTYGVGNDAP